MVPLPEARTDDNSTADLTGVIRARKQQLWRRRLLSIGIILAVLAVAAVAWFSPLLGLEKVEVSGSKLVDHDEVAASVIDTSGGTPLPQIRPGKIEKAVLKEFPRAQEASVHYGGPRTLNIEITDRTPVLAITEDAGFTLYDAEAVDLGTVDTAPKGVTVLGDSGGAPDQETAAAVIRFMAELRPELRREVTTIEAKDENTITGEIGTGETKAKVVFGDSTSASLKMRTAVQLAEDGRTDIDVSVPSVPVTN
ncbi:MULTISPECIES: FtsQ-type POTRA domain-containing protein [unclassified Brevibacterium]|uniref:cell division protein FtsQ/DivIB n=1 Tax=unclassified Brevibacterium TaxID=2614124 RepID=UPI001E29779E|nr:MULTISPECIES: FtsQ-type POTRA domain-containing protein [unclassified Brevibacterium]MCD1285174.1 cell division protein FtsQ [Brevibacterium sp. CCUG 69071]MDK8435203.1 FtsQ-type POTRA domain-containing protein [Brevibacterium sp. H-BE7]